MFYKKKYDKIIYFLLFLLAIFILMKIVLNVNSKTNEGFNNENIELAFNSPPFKKWVLDQSKKNWFKPNQNEYKIPFKDFGFDTNNNTKFSISFLYTGFKGSGEWRNIFRFTDSENPDSDGGMGDRNPALWVYPDNTNQFHFRFGTNGNSNDGLDSSILIPFGIPVLVTYVMNDNKISCYINDVLVNSGDFNNVYPRSDKTTLYVSSKNYKSDDIRIKNLTFYDGALTDQDIQIIYNKLQGPTLDEMKKVNDKFNQLESKTNDINQNIKSIEGRIPEDLREYIEFKSAQAVKNYEDYKIHSSQPQQY